MIGSVVFTLTFVAGWLLGIGQTVPPMADKPAQAQSASNPDARTRP